MLLSSFPPIVGDYPRILVLGSMPGDESLRQGRYYAYPANQFWMIMGELVGAGPDIPYEERSRRIVRAGIALWDTLKHCERKGSLDSSIRLQTEVPNAIGEFLAEYPSIQLVAFNGKKSAAAYDRHILHNLPEWMNERLRHVILPSTSPAYAGLSRGQKTTLWKAALEPYLKKEEQ